MSLGLQIAMVSTCRAPGISWLWSSWWFHVRQSLKSSSRDRMLNISLDSAFKMEWYVSSVCKSISAEHYLLQLEFTDFLCENWTTLVHSHCCIVDAILCYTVRDIYDILDCFFCVLSHTCRIFLDLQSPSRWNCWTWRRSCRPSYHRNQRPKCGCRLTRNNCRVAGGICWWSKC